MISVTFVGIGLIGGSLSLCLKNKYKDSVRIKAFDENYAQVQLAQQLGVIDQGYEDLEEAIEEADFIFMCTPVQSLCPLLRKVMLSSRLKKGAIITDVGSTKQNVVRVATELMDSSEGFFIGGHPMAGSHKSGVDSATERLFENAYYVLTPAANVGQEQLEQLQQLLAATKAQLMEMDAATHDQIVGAISHFPHLIASSLVEHVHQYNEQNEWYLRLAAGGFRDITRIASAHPRMWRDITLSNQQYLVQQLQDWQQRMEQVLELVAKGDPEEIEHFFAHAKEVRDGLNDSGKGAIPAFYDLNVDVPDHPGVIGQITTLLGENLISIINIAILETREDIMGALRLTFRNEEDLQRASKLIHKLGFKVYR